MIPIDELLYEIDLRLNKLASERHQMIADEDKIIALNNAQIALVKRKYGSLDQSYKRMDDLQLLVKNEVLSLQKLTDREFTADLTSLKDYMFFIKCWISASLEGCKDHPLDVSIIAHAEVQQWYNNVNLCPSFAYQETFGCLSSDNILIYGDGKFLADKLYLTYIRYPRVVDVSGYVHLDGTPSTTADCELPGHLKDELLDLCVMDIALNTENVAQIEATAQRLRTNE